ncbi:hypothetical protein HZA44_04670 [Candidatus Peregrinibacteria bacterium]|nr:hypothetical protein [Candidatus Peregrinibacteria bacterium]
MDKFLTLSYYLSARPDPNFQFTKLTLLIVFVLLAGAMAIKIIRRKKVKDEVQKKLLKRFPGPLFGFATALLALLVFRETGIPLFSMRIWWIALLVAFVVWAVKALLAYRKEYAEKSAHAHHRADNAQYLPRKKR